MPKGKPSKGTAADRRLSSNKSKAAPKKASGFVPFAKGGKKPKGK